jgi:hypothetical protein
MDKNRPKIPCALVTKNDKNDQNVGLLLLVTTPFTAKFLQADPKLAAFDK